MCREHKKIHIFPVLLRCELNFYIMQLITMTNNKEYTAKNGIELDIQSHKATSTTCSFVIFQMHWPSVKLALLFKPSRGSRNNFASIQTGKVISTFRTRLQLKPQNSLRNISQITSLNSCSYFVHCEIFLNLIF